MQLALVHVKAIGTGQTGVQPLEVQEPRHQLGWAGGVPIAHEADDRDAAIFLGLEQMIGNGLTYRAWFSERRFEVHQQAGSGIHFHNGAALGRQGLRDVLRHQVHTCNVQAYHPRSQHGKGRHIGVDLVGDIARHVAGAHDQHRPTGLRNAVGAQALASELQHRGGVLVESDGVEREIFFFSSPRVGVDLKLDQLRHVVHPIAHHAGGLAFVGRGHMVAHHQQAVFFAQDEALDQDLAAFGQGDVISRFNVLLFGKFERHTAGMVAVGGFDTHGQTDVLRRLPSRGGAVHNAALRHGHAAHGEQLLGQVFVFGYAFGNGAGAVGFSGPNAPLLLAMAQLNQVAIIEANGRNAALAGGIDNAGGAGADAQAVHQVFEAVDFGNHIEGAVFDGGQNQVARGLQGAAANRLVPSSDHDFVHTARAGFAGFAKTGLHARLGLQLQGHVFQHVASPCAFFQALQKAAALTHAAAVFDQPGQPGTQALVEAWQGVGWVVFKGANVDQCFQHGAVSPDVGPAQMGHAQKFKGVWVHE